MNNFKILSKILCGLCLLLMLPSCKKWIDVKPSDRLSEELVFQDEAGFMKALNGIYVEMASDALYGKNMSAGAIDVLAQYYVITSSTHPFYEYTTFVYTSADTKAGFDAAWTKAYELVANCNVIIEKCGNGPGNILKDPYYSIIKAEALALRAFLQFDMLRLFGPIYNDENKTLPAIPYRTKTDFNVAPLLPAGEAMQNVITDLKASLELLKDKDPVLTEGVRNENNPTGTNDLYYRQYRMNYYAVEALLARAYLWEQDKQQAYKTAKALLDEVQAPGKDPVFPSVALSSATDPEKPDRVFSTEVLFGVYDINRVNIFNTLFSADLQADARLSFNKGNTDFARVNELYDDANDIRRRIWQNVTAGTTTTLTNLKYQDLTGAPGQYMIPMIRLSEVLLIAAEGSPNLEEATSYLNQVRTSRNCFDLTAPDQATLQKYIGTEFRKEVIGEGQQFFYYKRTASQIVPNNAALVGTKTMSLNNYVVPLPDSETSQRNKDNE